MCIRGRPHGSKSPDRCVRHALDSPSSERLVALGSTPRTSGTIQSEKSTSIKYGTFGASSLERDDLQQDNFRGSLHIWDLGETFYSGVEAHSSITNAIDACGGLGIGYGALELGIGGRNGRVMTIGTPRLLIGGLARFLWELSTDNGAWGIRFVNSKMNKWVATLEFHVFDLKKSASSRMSPGSTIWGVKRLPQNRAIFRVLGGDGSLSVFKYSYPEQRFWKDTLMGYGKAQPSVIHNDVNATSQLFYRGPNEEGVAVMGAHDQCVRAVIVTNLHS
ncbi:hypothetical protein KP509_12G022800 [Ceratopteris richardii]|uniref:Uncharacterized protein n=1 Tax=Ceratopteris richardii TaxID=49495 RepID=A0A8T2TMR0_CERRI|nr:hypothetical protein KP509_12G022800 [Ceratopteris richardii]